MAEQSIIKVNKSSPTEIEFEVDITGLDKTTDKSAVRFVIENAGDGYDIVIIAKHIKDAEWKLVIPALSFLKKSSYESRLEVVLDGYYFVPAKATISMADEPTIKITSKATKTLIEDVETTEEVVTETVEDIIEEGVGGAGSPPPEDAGVSNLADIPEFSPESKLKYPKGSNADEHIDVERLNQEAIEKIASSVTGMEGPQIAVPEKESAAAKIVKSVIGNVKKPTVAGKLFKRSSTGKAIVEGLEDDETKAEYAKAEEAKIVKSKKVSEILKKAK
jgi:hypothetical protein